MSTIPWEGQSDVYDDVVTGPSISYSAPAIGTESLAFTVETPGWFAIAVWKVSTADRADSTIFNVQLTEVQAVGVQDEVPVARTQLVGAYPNPFNPNTTVAFDLDAHQNVKLEIFDIRGRLVDVLIDEPMAAGHHERVWRGLDSSGKGVASGVYMIRMTAGETVDLKRVSLIK